MAAFQVAVLVPRLKAAGGVIELDEPNPALHQPARQQTLAAEDLGGLVVDTVEPIRRRGFARQVEGVGSLHLHAIGQLEGFDAGAQSAVLGPAFAVQVVEAAQRVQLRALAVLALSIRIQVADRIFQVGDKGPLVRGG